MFTVMQSFPPINVQNTGSFQTMESDAHRPHLDGLGLLFDADSSQGQNTQRQLSGFVHAVQSDEVGTDFYADEPERRQHDPEHRRGSSSGKDSAIRLLL